MPAHSPFDPLDRLDPGEGRFVIREKDPAGPEGITGWSAARRLWAFKTYGTDPAKGTEERRLLDAELAQCAEAEEKALEWRERQTGGAQTETETRAAYAGATLTEEQVAAAKRQKIAADLDQHLAEADAAIHELLELDGASASPWMAERAAQLHDIAMAAKYGDKAEAA